LGSTSEPREPDWEALARSVWWRGKRSPSPLWRRKWNADPWLRRLSGLTCEPSTLARGVEWWIASLADTHASHSHQPASVVESRTHVTYGQMSLAFCENADPQSAFLRTSPVICRSEHTKSSASFKRWATALRAHCGQRRRSALPTAEKECSSWEFGTLLPTPTASDYGTQRGIGQQARPSLDTMARRGVWPTPTVQDSSNNGGASQMKRNTQPLNAAVRMWPTPVVGTHQQGDGPGLIVRVMEAERAASDDATGGKLNPTWVEWLMGFPLGWTDSALSETQSSPSKRHARSSSSTTPLHRIDCDMDEECTCSSASADAATKEE